MKSFKTPRQQHGAVLIVALIMLLLLTIIGIASMRGTSIQENMAGNMRDNTIAMQAAEAAVRFGETEVIGRFESNTLSTLDAGAVTGSYSGFPEVSAVPTYRITQLAKLRTTTEIGIPAEEGAIVRVEGDGYGTAVNPNNASASAIKIRSTFLVEQ